MPFKPGFSSLETFCSIFYSRPAGSILFSLPLDQMKRCALWCTSSGLLKSIKVCIFSLPAPFSVESQKRQGSTMLIWTGFKGCTYDDYIISFTYIFLYSCYTDFTKAYIFLSHNAFFYCLLLPPPLYANGENHISTFVNTLGPFLTIKPWNGFYGCQYILRKEYEQRQKKNIFTQKQRNYTYCYRHFSTILHTMR